MTCGFISGTQRSHPNIRSKATVIRRPDGRARIQATREQHWRTTTWPRPRRFGGCANLKTNTALIVNLGGLFCLTFVRIVKNL